MKSIILKPWGYEEIIFTNKHYTLKKLFMKTGHRCSLQYHKKKHETIYVLNGVLEVQIGKNKKPLRTKTLKKDNKISIEPGTIHRMKAKKNATYLEASTSELKDVVRLSDDYSRK